MLCVRCRPHRSDPFCGRTSCELGQHCHMPQLPRLFHGAAFSLCAALCRRRKRPARSAAWRTAPALPRRRQPPRRAAGWPQRQRPQRRRRGPLAGPPKHQRRSDCACRRLGGGDGGASGGRRCTASAQECHGLPALRHVTQSCARHSTAHLRDLRAGLPQAYAGERSCSAQSHLCCHCGIDTRDVEQQVPRFVALLTACRQLFCVVSRFPLRP